MSDKSPLLEVPEGYEVVTAAYVKRSPGASLFTANKNYADRDVDSRIRDNVLSLASWHLAKSPPREGLVLSGEQWFTILEKGLKQCGWGDHSNPTKNAKAVVELAACAVDEYNKSHHKWGHSGPGFYESLFLEAVFSFDADERVVLGISKFKTCMGCNWILNNLSFGPIRKSGKNGKSCTASFKWGNATLAFATGSNQADAEKAAVALAGPILYDRLRAEEQARQDFPDPTEEREPSPWDDELNIAHFDPEWVNDLLRC